MADPITIGCQGGGPETKVVGEAKVGLFHALSDHVTSTHCEAIDEFALILRVCGSLDDFGPESITRLRFAKAKRYMTVDILIPMESWSSLDTSALKRYLADRVRVAIEACLDRLDDEGIPVQKKTLMSQIQNGIDAYLGSTNTKRNEK